LSSRRTPRRADCGAGFEAHGSARGAKTKREAVELGLKTLVQLRAQEKARELKGTITWEGDLNAMRTDR